MTLFDFAKNNIIRDKRNYVFYFLNCVFSVFVFFLFTVLSFHPTMSVIDTQSTMGMILIVGELISIVFSLSFISYSAGAFIKSRKKQFGLITILGASKKQLNRLIFIENILIGILAIFVGIFFGMVFSKMFLDIVARIIGVSDFDFYFPVLAILTTILIFSIVFLCVASIVPRMIRKNEIIKLLKEEKKDEKKAPLKIALISVILIGLLLLTIYSAFPDLFQILSNMMLFPVLMALLVFLFTYVVIGYGMLFFLGRSSKQNISLIFKGELRAKMRSNLKVMTFSTILYAITFFSMIVLFSMSSNVKEETQKIMPYAMSCNTWEEKISIEDDAKQIDEILKEQKGYKRLNIHLYSLPDNPRSTIMSESAYNHIMDFMNRDTIELDGNDAYMVAGSYGDVIDSIPSETNKYLLNNEIKLEVMGYTSENVFLTGFVNSITVLDDEYFEMISPELVQKTMYLFDYLDWETNQAVVDKIMDQFEDKIENREINIIDAYRYYQTSKLQNNLTLYVGSMLCFTFILAIGSFIYSRLYTGLEAESAKFKGIVKIGLSKKELRKILYRETALLLVIPFVFALFYLWVGILITDKYVFVSNIPTGVIGSIILIIIQIILYVIVSFTYKNAFFEKVYE